MDPSPLTTALALLCLASPALALQATVRADTPESAGEPATPDSAAFALDALDQRLDAADGPYLPFLRTRSLRCGLYRLPAGGRDDQPVHEDDEIYYVIRGRATLLAGDERHPALPGATLFVKAGVVHRFVDIEEDLEVLVVFGETQQEVTEPAKADEPNEAAEPGAPAGATGQAPPGEPVR